MALPCRAPGAGKPSAPEREGLRLRPLQRVGLEAGRKKFAKFGVGSGDHQFQIANSRWQIEVAPPIKNAQNEPKRTETRGERPARRRQARGERRETRGQPRDERRQREARDELPQKV